MVEIIGSVLEPNSTLQSSSSLMQLLWRREFQWAELISFAAGQDILAPVVWSLTSRSLLPAIPKNLPSEKKQRFITTRLHEAWHEHAVRQDDLRAQLYDCLAALNGAGITPVLLKGARYLSAAEPHWAAARPMRDIDLLIRPEHSNPAIAALRGIGYVADAPSGLQSHHLPELRLPGRHGAVELHTEALAPAGAKFLPTELVWQKSKPVEMGDALAWALPPAWQGLHAMLHHQVSDDGYAQRIIAFKPLWEFCRLKSDSRPEDWENLWALPEIGNYLASWNLQAERIFGLTSSAKQPAPFAARLQVEACFSEAVQPEWRRRIRFLARQLRRGFARDTIAARYAVPHREAGFRLRARHAWFLIRRYRRTLRDAAIWPEAWPWQRIKQLLRATVRAQARSGRPVCNERPRRQIRQSGRR